MRNCVVPGCDRKNKNNLKRPMFVVPKDGKKFSKWMEALHTTRRPIREGDRVCYLHFHQDEIQKCFEHRINGQIYQLERDRMRLMPCAVPSLNLPSEEDLLLLKRSCRPKRPTAKIATQEIEHSEMRPIASDQSEVDQQKKEIYELEYPLERLEAVCPQEEEAVVELNAPSEQCNLDRLNETFNNIYEDIFEVVLPNTLWGIHRCPQRTVIFFSYMDAVKMCATKMLTVHCDGAVNLYMASHLTSTLSILNEVQTTDTLSELLSQLDETRICSGLAESDDCEVTIKDADQQLCKNCLANNTQYEAIDYVE